MTYYLLCEPFSAYSGLALSGAVSHMMRFDGGSVVVCPDADDTWGFAPNRIMVNPRLHLANIRGWQHVPLWMRRQFFSRIFRSVLLKLQTGDIVWCLNWPNIAESLEQGIHSRGAKLIYHAQNSLGDRAARNGLKALNADAIIFNSEAMRQEVLSLLPSLSNTYTIHNGADERLFHPLPPGSPQKHPVPVILYVGRLVHIKGVHVLIEAMRILQARNVQAICRLIGAPHAGGSKDRVTPYIRALKRNCPSNVQFDGFRAATEIAQEYRAADIFCCPSIWQEPFGNVNIEAMASGVPVVASRVGGIPEIAVGGGVLLVEPDSAVELADALQALIRDETLRLTMAADALASFRQRFTWTAITRQQRNLMESLDICKTVA